MPTEAEKKKIRKLAKNGESVNTIKEKLGLPKSTVYYHFRKEVGQKQKENALKIPENREKIGEICGIYAGDGSHYYDNKKGCHDIRIHLNQKEKYWKILASHLEKILQKRAHVYYGKDNRNMLEYMSKPLYNMLRKELYWGDDKTETISLKDKQYTDKFKIGFLRGLIDTDGYMRPNGRTYQFTTISKNLSNSIIRLLEHFKIEYREYQYEDERENHRRVYSVYLRGENAIKFGNKIEPRNPKRQFK